MTLLQTISLTRRYSGLVAVDSVDITVDEGVVHAVIGPNGAGKTTLFNLLSGLAPPTSGSIAFTGRDVTHMPAHRRAGLGMARTFQNIRVFTAMTVLENVLTGLHVRLGASLADIVFRTARFRTEERDALASAQTALDLVGLGPRANERADALSYGDQRRLEVARAMAATPRLLLLDEPAAGMNPAETAALGDLVRTIRDLGTTVLLVEHDMGFVMDVAERATVLNFGRLIYDGPAADIRHQPAVVEAYLGTKMAERLTRRAA